MTCTPDRSWRARAVLAALAAAALLTACDPDPAGTAASEDVALVQPGRLTVCAYPHYEPFVYRDGEAVVGFDIAILEQVAESLGAELAVVETGFDEIASGAALDAGTCDVAASGITITPEREAVLDFTDPYFDADLGLLVPVGSGLTSLDALADRPVGVPRGTTAESFAAEHRLASAAFDDAADAVDALRSGDVAAVLDNVAVLGPRRDATLVLGATFLTGEQYGFAVRSGNTALLAAIDATLAEIAEDRTYDSLYATHVLPRGVEAPAAS